MTTHSWEVLYHEPKLNNINICIRKQERLQREENLTRNGGNNHVDHIDFIGKTKLENSRSLDFSNDLF